MCGFTKSRAPCSSQTLPPVRFGKERIDYVCSGKRNLDCVVKSFPRLVKDIYFCPDFPENHTIQVTNVRLPYIKVFDGDKWSYMCTTSAVFHIIGKCIDALDAMVDPYYPPEGYQQFCDSYDRDDKSLLRKLQLTVRNVLRSQVHQHRYTQPMRRPSEGRANKQSQVAFATV